MDKSLSIIKIIILSVLALCLIGILVFFCINGFRWGSWNNAPQSPVSVCSFNKKDVSSVDIEWELGKVTVQSSEKETIEVNQVNYGKDEDMHVSAEVSNGKLTVRSINRNYHWFLFNFGTNQVDLEVYLPQQQYKEFVLRASMGDVNISNIETSNVHIKADMGKVYIKKTKGTDFTIEAGMGEIQLADVEGDTLNCDADMGSVTLDNCAFHGFDAKISMGALDAKLSNAPKSMDLSVSMGSADLTIADNDGFTANVDVDMGNFSSDFTSSISSGLSNKGSYVYKDGEKRNYTISVDMGDLRLNKAS